MSVAPLPRMVVNYETGLLTIGKGASQRRHKLTALPNTNIKSLDLDPIGKILSVRFSTGERAAAELYDPSDRDPRAGRPVVYLDQCHWSTLANLRFRGSAVRDSEREPASRLTALAQSGRIILPISGGHLVESGELFAAKRRALASTMLRYSRGWQMRDPFTVRATEVSNSMGSALRAAESQVSAVFTLEPNVVFGQRIANVPSPAHFSSEFAQFYQSIVSITVLLDSLIDSTRVPRGDASNWAAKNEEFVGDLQGKKLSKRDRDKQLLAGLMLDLETEIQTAVDSWQVSEDELLQWIREFEKNMQTLPFIGIHGTAMAQRQRDPNLKWHVNDLTDIVYLSCAGGYADIVVAEKRASRYLSNAARALGRDVNIFPSIADAIDSIEFAAYS